MQGAQEINNMPEIPTTARTFFKVAKVNPLDTLKQEFIDSYSTADRQMLIDAGLVMED